ncbi:MAG: YbdD/YjiX family protein [Steroidobacteraceae bacterium]
MKTQLVHLSSRLWALIRLLSTDDAYERYLAHRARHHAAEPLLDRRAFYLCEQEHKWNGVKRCC